MAKAGAEKPNDTMNVPDPKTAAEFAERGWTHYGKREFYRAEADFRKALETAPDDIEVVYALGLSLSASGRAQDAYKIFERVIQMRDTVPPEQHIRATMLARLAQDHITRGKINDSNAENK